MKLKNLFTYAAWTTKLFIAYVLLNIFYRDLYSKDLWLICEKKSEARDNGYHLFKYIRRNHPEVNAYYVITPDSVDIGKVRKYGNIIFCGTIKNFIYYLAAKNSINSQPGGAHPFKSKLSPKYIKLIKYLRNKEQKTIFLQHGISKDFIAGFDYRTSLYDLFVVSTEREKKFITTTFRYPNEHVQCLGLCRFDNLHHTQDRVEKKILIMPTFRNWLVSNNPSKPATIHESTIFTRSEYYNTYMDLLESYNLKSIMNHYGYKLIFYPHYSSQSYIHLFKKVESEEVIIADRGHYDVQELLITSAVLVTDFSSVFFDFAYMGKPEIYFQFDEEKFREQHYKKGYFSYEDDGFGPVVRTIDELVGELEKYIINGMKVEEKYMRRSMGYFTLRDGNNCKRNYEAISKLG